MQLIKTRIGNWQLISRSSIAERCSHGRPAVANARYRGQTLLLGVEL